MEKKWFLLLLAWVVSVISTLGSLFFSEVMILPPCILCWYQRICMYPLVILLTTGLVSSDKSLFKYSFPLASLGFIIAAYHNLLYYKILPESSSPCVRGISCTTVQINWFGFITIPLLSMLGFSLLLILLFFWKRAHQDE